ncbi:glycosyltransferase family protein [Telmatospirillum sp.]|uniref:glycosyltransferase family protein n=1 Tax=Telmatospirillum sp. TaxID=2079197 RepID=UPI00284A96C6|nr:glycosyltransferase family protein [Telmatospirillum sp.]MDR3437109.1 glycosyltransferase family protein [Telmatospirillum sp.]
MTPRLLFLINGLGLGNSTRCHAVIERLAAAGAEIEIVTSDNGLWFFDGKGEITRVTAIPSLRYGADHGRISILRTLGQAGRMWWTLRQAEAILSEVINRFQPHVVVSDSVYALGPVRRAGLPLAALNNADMVTRGMGRFGDWPASVLPQFLFIELGDYLHHRIVPDLVISPRLDPSDGTEGRRLRRVGPIVRRDCRPQPVETRPPSRVVIMLSGSVFGSSVTLARRHDGLRIDVIGRPAPEPAPDIDGVTFHGKLRDSLALTRQADLLIVNGGFSAVSEALVLRKPMVVIPVPRHAEQWVNGRTIRHLGVGTIGSEDRLEASLDDALGRIDDLRGAYQRLPPAPDGAAEAADLLLKLAGGRP